MAKHYKTYLERHFLERGIYRAEEDTNSPNGYALKPFGCERGLFANWSGDWQAIEVRRLSSRKIVGKYPLHPLAGAVSEKPWRSDL